MKEKVAIVNSSSFGKYFPEHISRLAEKFEVVKFEVPAKIPGKELAQLLYGCKYIIASTTPFFDKEFFNNKDETILISRHGLGYDNIDIISASESETIVTKVDGSIEKEAVAEHAVALCMSVIRMVPKAYESVRVGKWSERQKFFGIELKDKVVGIIGFGNIGSRVGEIMNFGFGAKVVAYDPFIDGERTKACGARKVSLEELLRNSDIIFVCSLL
ncbi:MAG: NAD(P)-dependent oxidoreductase, partial [Fervidobacterium sp.]